MTTAKIRSARTRGEVERTVVGAARAFADADEAEFRRRILDAPGLPVENTLLAFVEDELVSSLQCYERRLWLAGVPVPVLGIGNVWTLPDHRGEGHASDLLRAAREFAVETGHPLAMLVGDPDFYARLGWTPVPAESTIVADPAALSGHATADSNGGPSWQWTPFAFDRDLDAIVAIHRARREAVDGTLDRDRALWRGWVFEVLVEPAEVYCYREDGTITGYLVASSDGENVVCLEAEYGGENRRAFLAACWNRLAREATDRVVWDPPLQSLDDRLHESGHHPETVSVGERTGETPMVWADQALLDTVTGGAFGSARAVAGRMAGDARYVSVLDKF